MAAPPVPLVSGMTWLSKAVVVNHDTGAETEVGVVSATVTLDRKSDARRVVDCELTPDVDPALLTAPHRLKLYAGYRSQGVDYWAALAHVRMGARSRKPLGAWQIGQARSFETLVAAAKFREPRLINKNASLIQSIRTLILEAVPWATIDVFTHTDAQSSGVTYEKERWQAIAGREESMATALGVDVGCDGDGVFVIRDVPSGDPVWYLSEGAGGLLIDYDEQISADNVTNVWIASSDHPDTNPVRAIAEDTNSFSPTRTARWGESVGFYSSPLLTTARMCQNAAETRLAGSRGLSIELSMTSVPNPWADITDIVGSTRDGVPYQHVLDQITHRLEPDKPMQSTAAARTVNIGG